MKSLNRQKKDIYYALYLGVEDIRDKNGFLTGEKRVLYSDPVKTRCTFANVYRNDKLSPFGDFLDYDRSMVIDDINTPINEETILWVDRDVEEPYDYVIRRFSKSQNHVVCALRRVNL